MSWRALTWAGCCVVEYSRKHDSQIMDLNVDYGNFLDTGKFLKGYSKITVVLIMCTGVVEVIYVCARIFFGKQGLL